MATATSLKNAVLLDFTGTAKGFRQMRGFGPELVRFIRGEAAGKTIVAIDREVGGQLKAPAVVRDHLNLTGTSPLLGPNDPCGDRFPVVQGVYVDDALPSLSKVVVAGLKPGTRLSEEDRQLIAGYGAQVSCYNVVPTMLIAAHARCRLLAVLLPEGAELPQSLADELKSLVGGS